ncbi:MAG: phytoene desaturase family protein [bacterium]
MEIKTVARSRSNQRRPAFCVLKVISNADPTMVYKHMIPAEHRRKHTNGRLKRVQNSMSLFVAYFGANKTWTEQAHHTIVLGPRYKGLLDDVFDKKVLADDFSLYLHAPTRSDASVAPPGHENMYVLSPVPNLKGNINWEEEGPRYYDRIMESLEKRMLPGLRESIVTSKFITPEYFRDTLGSEDGAAFGPEPILQQSAWFRYHNRSEDVDGLYFVGAGTHPGAGLPGVLCTAKVLDRVIDEPAESDKIPVPPRPHQKSANEVDGPKPAGTRNPRQVLSMGVVVPARRMSRRCSSGLRVLPFCRRHCR